MPNYGDKRALKAVLNASNELDSSLACEDCSWDDVLESMQVARDDYDAKMSKATIKNIHKNKAIMTTLNLLTDMIPDRDGLSVLRGGLRLIFNVRFPGCPDFTDLATHW
jgi:hypothetical protein